MRIDAKLGIAAAALAACVLAPGVIARPGAQAPEPQAAGGQPTFRAGTRLATFDAVVTDRKGRHITDLTPAAFEVVERGKPQAVRQVVYVHAVRAEGATPPAAGASAGADAPATPDIAMPGRPGLPSRERTGRVMAIVVDDLRMQFRSTVDVRKMLNRYIDQQIQPGDLVAIIRTAGGAGALQQFTTDRRLLRAAVERIRWSPRVWPFDPLGPWEGSGEGLADRFERDVTLEGSLGALAYAVRGVQASPGRKTVVFVSEGFSLATPSLVDTDALADVDHVIDVANRGGVVMYGIDPRGLVNPVGAGGAGTFSAQRHGPDPSYTNTMAPPTAFAASVALFEQHGSLEYLAKQTGGFAVVHQNNLAGALERIVTDTRGYYLIGFDTAIPPGVRADEGEVRIRVKRKDLQVRARRDRFGPADPDPLPPPPPLDPLLSTALSPFATGTLDVRIAALFGHDATEGDYVRALVAIDPAGLTLAETAGGGREGNLTLLVFALDDQGIVVGQTREVVDVRLDAAAYDRARQHGLRYAVRLPFKKAGGYQIRAAVRDERSQAIGASAQFVEVPRVGQKRVALSGLVLAEPGDGGTPLTTTFAPGSRVEYRGTLYDGQRLGGGFSVSATVLRDGKLVHASPPAPLAGAPAEAPTVAPIPFSGTLTLGDDYKPGLYTLQVTIEPELNGKKGRPMRQWVDFEVR
jgi:VWFA-related protein